MKFDTTVKGTKTLFKKSIKNEYSITLVYDSENRTALYKIYPIISNHVVNIALTERHFVNMDLNDFLDAMGDRIKNASVKNHVLNWKGEDIAAVDTTDESIFEVTFDYGFDDGHGRKVTGLLNYTPVIGRAGYSTFKCHDELKGSFEAMGRKSFLY